ncbi:DUF2851 family protein [Polaribacter sp.]|uniref:DUF2851 family protein n=1 Tax=Polaribacter sp. TaxID=1920175 RepID=UPI003F6C2229
MNEDFLHYVWKFKLFANNNLHLTSGEGLEILKFGMHNFNAGPDFLNSQIKIDGQVWVGNVEIHLKSSDWYLHKHEKDPNYDAVILHVVWEHDGVIYMKNNQPLPTLVLKDLVDIHLLKNYKVLLFSKKDWIPCEKSINKTDDFILENWKERLFFERLERKSSFIKNLLTQKNNNFEAVLFQLLAKNFGLKINGDAFLRLATSMDFSVVQKVSFSEYQFAALLFGQAGFLEEALENDYHLELKNEYQYLKHKYHLKPISKAQFSFFRMRPNNFPTIRIAQLVAVFTKQNSLFSKLIHLNDLQAIYDLFAIEVHSFWKTHYHFDSISKKSPKRLTKSFIDLLIINTILPLKFLYQKSRGDVDEDSFLSLIKSVKPEKNSIVSKFSDLGILSKNAFDTQALLELKNNYCAPKQCLRCAIGKTILNKK